MRAPRFVYCNASLAFGDHIFPVRKYEGVRNQLLAAGRITEADIVMPDVPLTRAQIERVHTGEYLDRLLQYANTTPEFAVAELEVPCYPETLHAVELAAAGTLAAARTAVETGTFGYHIGGGFHHAFANHGEGFCIINDIAVAIRLLLDEGTIERALVVDVDVHQGNGTAVIFKNEPLVTTFSIHNQAIYPSKVRSDLDIGVAPFTDDAGYLAALDPAIAQLIVTADPRPQLMVYVAGADPFAEDQLGGLRLTKAGLRERDRRVLIACRDAGIPVAVVLAGGYARRTSDVVDIHCATAEVCLDLWPAAG
ncbi:MAG: histone deacetylase [Planctomycetota bacterium]